MSVNRAFILGNLGQDPELKYTPNGTPVCSFSIATTEVRNDREGNRQESTEWHRIVVWNKQAENCAKYLSKGRTVFIEGRIQTRSWDDKTSGQKRYTTEIVAHSVQFIGSGSGQPRDPQGSNQDVPDYSREGSSGVSGAMARPSYGNDIPSLDDIPF